MLPITHFLAPIVALMGYGLLRERRYSRQTLLITGLFGLLPDLLNIHISLAARVSWSHSLLILPPLLLLALTLPARYRGYGKLLLLAVTIHIGLDILSNPYNFLYPLQFSYSTDLYPELGDWFIAWYAFDSLMLLSYLALDAMTTPRTPANGP